MLEAVFTLNTHMAPIARNNHLVTIVTPVSLHKKQVAISIARGERTSQYASRTVFCVMLVSNVTKTFIAVTALEPLFI